MQMFLFIYMHVFISPRDLQVPAADRRETLPRDRQLGALYNACPKFGVPSPTKISVPKTPKISGDFILLQTSIANISGNNQDIQNRKDMIEIHSSCVL